MGKMHTPVNHPEFGKEKGEGLSVVEKQILHSLRDAVNAVQDISESKRLETHELVRKVKQKVSNNLSRSFDEKIEQAITTALRLQAQQYKNITPERFAHRLKNNKLKRDFLFLLKAGRILNQSTPETIWSITKRDVMDGNFQGLNTSESLRSIRILLNVMRANMEIKQFQGFLKDIKDNFQK